MGVLDLFSYAEQVQATTVARVVQSGTATVTLPNAVQVQTTTASTAVQPGAVAESSRPPAATSTPKLPAATDADAVGRSTGILKGSDRCPPEDAPGILMPSEQVPRSDFWSTAISTCFLQKQKTGSLIAKAVGGPLFRDALFSLPHSYVDRRRISTLSNFVPDEINTFEVVVEAILSPARPNSPHIISVADSTGKGEIALFNKRAVYFYNVGAKVTISGEVTGFMGRPRMNHPEVYTPENKESACRVDPVWPMTAGVSKSSMREFMGGLALIIPDEPEWISRKIIDRYNWPGFSECLRRLHHPDEMPTPDLRARLVYDECFARQVSLNMANLKNKSLPGRSFAGDGSLLSKCLEKFGHELTDGQSAALGDILSDMQRESRMFRLIQGDVGSGKTIVIVMAMMRAVEANAQSVLLAPTDLLAKQHYRTLSAISPVEVVLLTAALSQSERKSTLKRIASGQAKIIVGTHSVFQKTVAYDDLGLIVIDEQHRFGVDDRAALVAKGNDPDVLLATATPIPRTMLLSHVGWMDVSIIKGKPNGRLPIVTTTHPVSTVPEVYAGIDRMISKGSRVYWVCPMVEENPELGLSAAVERHKSLCEIYGDRVGLAHGRQASQDREEALQGFASGRFDILVSTTVVEVGVDVPEASVIVIEHSELFGAAQLHQLRGRVGRGAQQSYCLLLHSDSASYIAKKRLALLRETNDGFRISTEDFNLRGGGDLVGTRQSGAPSYRFYDPEEHADLMELAVRDANTATAVDPDFVTPRGVAIRRCLDVFGFALSPAK